MRKKLLSLFLCIALLLTITGNLFGNVNFVEASETDKSVYSFSDDYQTESADTGIWRYYVREVVSNTFTALSYNSNTGRWEAPSGMGSAYIWKGAMHPSGAATASADYQTVLQFVAPRSGTVVVSFPNGIKVDATSTDGVKLSFWANGTSDQRFNSVTYTAGTTAIQNYTVEVVEGQQLNFLLHRNASTAGDTTQINPTITYTGGVYSFSDDYQTESADTGIWRYYVREVVSNTFTALSYNSNTGRWEAPSGMGSAYIWKGAMYPSGAATASADYQTVLQFVAPKNGTVVVSFPNGIKVDAASADGVKLSFWANGTSDQRFNSVTYTAGTTAIQNYTVEVVEGQQLNFLLHRNASTAGDTTQINPTITYEESSGNVDLGAVEIILVSPEENSEIAVVSDSVAEWLSTYNSTDMNFSSAMGQGADSFYGGVKISWTATEKANRYIIKYAADAELTGAKTITTEETSAVLDNLCVGTKYYWQVEAVYDNGSVQSEIFDFITAETPRTVIIEGVSNTRDIGGIGNVDGIQLKQGMIYRGATLDDITEKGKSQALADLGIKTDLDFRESGEMDAEAGSPLGNDVNYFNITTYAYNDVFTEEYWDDFAAAIKIFADEDNYPIYMHGQNGRDRTGTIAFLLEGLLGVDKEQIFRDYELSFFSAAGGEKDIDLAAARKQVDILYNDMCTAGDGDFYDNVEALVMKMGVTKEDIASIRKIMLGIEPSDEDDEEQVKKVFSFMEDYQTDTSDSGIWRYYVREVVSNTYTALNYNSDTGRWEAPTEMGSAYIWKGAMYPSGIATATTDHQTVLQFVAPYSGTITVSFPNGIKVSSDSNDGVRLSFWANGTNEQKFTNVLYNAGTSEIQEYTFDVVEGQILNFLLHRNGNTAGDTTQINPTITYTSIDTGDVDDGEDDNDDDSKPGDETKPGDGSETEDIINAIKVYDSESGFVTDSDGVWSYYQRDVCEDTYTPLTFNSERACYENADSGAWISKNMQSTSVDAAIWTVRAFTAPYSGTIAISFKDAIAVTDAEVQDMVFVKVWHNGEAELLSKYMNGESNSLKTIHNIAVQKGDKIYFMVGSASGNNKSVTWAPIVSYTAIGTTEETPEGTVNAGGNTTQTASKTPKTGDDFQGNLYAVAAVMSLAMMICLVYRKKRNV